MYRHKKTGNLCRIIQEGIGWCELKDAEWVLIRFQFDGKTEQWLRSSFEKQFERVGALAA